MDELPDETGRDVDFLAILVADADVLGIYVAGRFDGPCHGIAGQTVQAARIGLPEIVAVHLRPGPGAGPVVQVGQPLLAHEMEVSGVAPVASDAADSPVFQSARHFEVGELCRVVDPRRQPDVAVDPGLREEIDAFLLKPREVFFVCGLVGSTGAVVTADDDVLGQLVELGTHAGEVPLAVERALGDHQAPPVLLDGFVQLQHIVENQIGDLVERQAGGLEPVDVHLGDVHIEQFTREALAQFVDHRGNHLHGFGLADVESHDPRHFFAGSDAQVLVLGLVENEVGVAQHLQERMHLHSLLRRVECQFLGLLRGQSLGRRDVRERLVLVDVLDIQLELVHLALGQHVGQPLERFRLGHLSARDVLLHAPILE